MDIAFLFWSIAAGIVLAAGLIPLAVLGSLFVGAVLLVFSRQKNGESPYILVVRCASPWEEEQVRALEVRLREADTGFVNELGAMSGVDHVVLVSYNGDYMG